MRNALVVAISVLTAPFVAYAFVHIVLGLFIAYAQTLDVSGRGGFMFVVLTIGWLPILLSAAAAGIGAAVWVYRELSKE